LSFTGNCAYNVGPGFIALDTTNDFKPHAGILCNFPTIMIDLSEGVHFNDKALKYKSYREADIVLIDNKKW